MSVLTKKQEKTYGPRPISGWGKNAQIKATVRYDDRCGNGHNTFSITGEIFTPGKRDCEAGGCLHDEVSKHFPELAPFIKWHLVSSDGPLYYVANTVYHASDRDCWGLRLGEFQQNKKRETGLPMWKLDANFGGIKYVSSAEKPWPVTFSYKPYGKIGEGKKRELDFARSSAVWPEATDEDLTSDTLKEKLLARLPKLLEDFQRDVESLGFIF